MKLTNQNISQIMSKVEKFFNSVGVVQKDVIKICMIIEDSLLQYQEKFGENCKVKFKTEKWFSVPKVTIHVAGEKMDPLKGFAADNVILGAKIMRNLLDCETVNTNYEYKNGYNVLCSFSTTLPANIDRIPGGAITLSTVAAIIFSIISNYFFPPNVQNFFLESVSKPLLSALMGLIIAITIPTIFISIVASMCKVKDLQTLYSFRSRVIGRFFTIMLIIALLTMGIGEIFFSVVSAEGDSGSFEFGTIFNLLLTAVPRNIMNPFSEGNILQVVILAFLIGEAVVSLGNRILDFRKVVSEIDIIVQAIIQRILKIIPIVIFLSIFQASMTGNFSTMGGALLAVALQYIVYILISSIMLIRIRVKYGVSTSFFIRSVWSVMVTAVTTGSTSVTMGQNMEVCRTNFKIKDSFIGFWIPISHAIFSATMVSSLIANAFYAAEFSGVTFSITQLLILLFLAIQLSIVTVKAPGGILATLGILFTQMGLSLDAIGSIFAANLLVANPSGAFSTIIRDCELIDVAHYLKVVQDDKNTTPKKNSGSAINPA